MHRRSKRQKLGTDSSPWKAKEEETFHSFAKEEPYQIRPQEGDQCDDTEVAKAEAAQEPTTIKEEWDQNWHFQTPAATTQDVEPADNEQPAEFARVRRGDLTAADIIRGIKTGEFAALANDMRDKIGIPNQAWDAMHPRQAVEKFLERYNGPEADRHKLYYFQHKWDRHRFLCTMVVQGFHGREIKVISKSLSVLDKPAAETAACLTFKLDKEVNAVRLKLPAAMKFIRQFFCLGGKQKAELTTLGFQPKVVQSDITTAIYNGFRPLGCQTSFWDADDVETK
ncbi:unnamed protein product [Symbiodinium sp. CCMP2592]|nr:unnamed protein product [Symbiodinium sp. CCMP2592]